MHICFAYLPRVLTLARDAVPRQHGAGRRVYRVAKLFGAQRRALYLAGLCQAGLLHHCAKYKFRHWAAADIAVAHKKHLLHDFTLP